jgi:murein DD-endopeptidase MepM/ murein hydrolase activator NlpD
VRKLAARWRAFAAAGATRRASEEIWSLIRAHRLQSDLATAAKPALAWPVAGRITSHFGMRRGRLHEGLDIAQAAGTPVRAALPGVVLLAGELGAYGNVVVLLHSSALATVYAHLDRVDVTREDRVERGRQLGTVGATGHAFGVHLHFEVRFEGTAVDPLVFLEVLSPRGEVVW